MQFGVHFSIVLFYSSLNISIDSIDDNDLLLMQTRIKNNVFPKKFSAIIGILFYCYKSNMHQSASYLTFYGKHLTFSVS